MQKIQAIKRPTTRSQSNLSNLISNTQSLVTDESDWIRCGPDLAALGRGSEHGWLNAFLEDMLNRISMRLTMASIPFVVLSNCYPYLSTHLSPIQYFVLNTLPVSSLTSNATKPIANEDA